MTFGEQLKQLRLSKSKMGLSLFAKSVGINPSRLSDIEHSYEPPPEVEILNKMMEVMSLSDEDRKKLLETYAQKFVMARMPQYLPSPFIHDSNGNCLSPEKITELIEWMNQRVEIHNQKADRYNQSNTDNATEGRDDNEGC